MTAEVCSAGAANEKTAEAGAVRPTVESVAKVVAAFSVIGDARIALAAAGWAAAVTANRIAVEDEVFAKFIPARTGTYGLISARWVVYSAGEEHPVWIVGAAPSDSHASPGGRSVTPRGGV